jgi:hypothetical protein
MMSIHDEHHHLSNEEGQTRNERKGAAATAAG